MSRLVVVSNRVGDIGKSSQAGGLTVAVGDALSEHGGLWFGWNGEVDDQPSRSQVSLHSPTKNVVIATVPLSSKEHENYYLGYSNRVLWPIFHYRVDLAEFEGRFLDEYRRVNQKFANYLIPYLQDDDVIWVHDYHLIPLGAELRARRLNQKIGFFLHIPFPPRDVLVATPEHEWLVRSLFSYDVIGLQTQNDLSNFLNYVLQEAEGEIIGDGRVRAFDRTIIVDAFPIGIDVDAFAAMAQTEESEAIIRHLQRGSIPNSHIIGVDRLDYTKGLPDRFRAFHRLLEVYPENRKQVTLMQIAAPTREDVLAYSDIREELEGLSGQINGEFGDIDWTPVRYIHRSVPRPKLAALFRGSQVGLVTPLRDGMNLVAKEYIAAQNEDSPGVLVLSKFAGAAEELLEALQVNPLDIDNFVEELQRALTMPIEERRERHKALLKRIGDYDIVCWRERFLNALKKMRLGAAA